MKLYKIAVLYTLLVMILMIGRPASGASTSSLNHLLGEKDACLLAAPDGTLLVSVHVDQALIPASTLKLLTALASYHYLGKTHRFLTAFFLDNAGNLKIKGHGDPLVTSEVMAEMAKAVHDRLATRAYEIKDLVLDTSFFAAPLAIPGVTDTLNPYDAPNGALCANFNTVSFKRLKKGAFISGEPQTPLLPCVLPRIRASGLNEGRIILSNRNDEAAIYFGELFLHFLKQNGTKVKGVARLGRINPKTDQPIFSYLSPFSLDDTVSRLMAYSNNFIANQLLITFGAKAIGEPGTLTKGVTAVMSYAEKELGLGGKLQLVEGSGISRGNRISAETMQRVLDEFRPRHQLLRETDTEYYKTGTLTGISTRAGYLKGKDGRLLPFVVMINTPGRSTDQVMTRLRKIAARW